MEHQQRQLRLQREQDVQRSTQQQLGSLPWVPQTTPTSQQAPSLLQIQQEEESQAKEMVSLGFSLKQNYIHPAPNKIGKYPCLLVLFFHRVFIQCF